MEDDPQRTGEDALRRGEWEQARSHFAQALADRETPEARDGMARALWWLADVEGAVAQRARAFAAFRRRGELEAAARIAFWLSREYGTVLQNPAAAGGWFSRGQRLVDELPTGPAHGWRDLARAQRAPDPATQTVHAEQAYAVARRFDDPDLEIYALAQLGLARIATGDVTRGIAELDEAMASAGEAAHLETTGDTLCTMMLAIELVGDTERFGQWTRALETFMSAHQHLPLYAFCFTCCGEVFADAGQWEAADEQFRTAIAALEQSSHASRCAHPVARLAQLRIRQGRLEEAEGLLAAYRDLPEAVQPLATLQLAQGQPAAAGRTLERRLAIVGEVNLLAAPLLSLLVEARTAQGDTAGAGQAAGRLAQIAEVSDLDRVRGLAALASGRVAVAAAAPARIHLEEAVRAFERARVPMELAIARRELAQVLAADDPPLAADEARAALHSFEQLGAAREADRTTALLRSLGVRGRTGPRNVGMLSRREQEVLELLATGLTNAEIAARLFISTKTAGNHVSNVLMKLGVRSRTEAAALALRHPPAA